MTDIVNFDLWSDIKNFEFGHSDASLSFAERLARDNAWDREFAERVIGEYRRFCYLGMTAGHPVTPSEEVDQAWHLHLLYTENYWTDFCGGVLRQPFHHGPTRGGRREGEKFHDWYQATLDSYERAFGEPPPVEIWPAAEDRFRNAHRFRRVNCAAHWVIPKPTARDLKRWLIAIVGLPLLAACAAGTDGIGGILPTIGGVIVLLVILGYVNDRLQVRAARKRRKAAIDGGQAVTGWMSAWLFWRGDQTDPGPDIGNSGGDGSSGCGGAGCGGGGCGS